MPVDAIAYMQQKQTQINAALDKYLPREDTFPDVLNKAMRYSVFSGGKRFRPILCVASYEGCGGTGVAILPVACAIELVHTYSLVHDDLPCMDDDDLRRGRPTSHKVFGEAFAVLAGDALLSFAVELVLVEGSRLLDTGRLVRVLGDLMKAAGPKGMVAGQVVDIDSQGKKPDADTVRFIHTRKTGALIASSARCGAIAAGAIDSVVDSVSVYGSKIGLAFQIMDDVLDVEGKFAGMKSGRGLDEERKKMTYPAAFGLEESKGTARQLVEEAKQALSHLGEAGLPLALLADLVVDRSS